MQTAFDKEYLATVEGQQANDILRSCVHCGFCTATCPTYLLTGNELDSPRGRIYLIKEMLEGGEVSSVTQSHLDKCLGCQSCETTCPSNVNYHRLLDIGRKHVETNLTRPWRQQFKRDFLRKLLTNKWLFNGLLGLGRWFRFIMPKPIARHIPLRIKPGKYPLLQSTRKMIMLNGCVQKSISPNTNAATARVLAKLDIQIVTVQNEGCCGALDYHMGASTDGLNKARHNIDLLCHQLDQGVEAIVSTASGCGSFIKEYSHLLSDDSVYSAKAQRVVDHCKDLSEVLMKEDLKKISLKKAKRLAFHCPCSLQHGQQLGGTVEYILEGLGFTLTPVAEGHICCGSAGTYSLFQPELAQRLKENKVAALEAGRPKAIATANIGCQSHLASQSTKPVQHWIEYIDEAIRDN